MPGVCPSLPGHAQGSVGMSSAPLGPTLRLPPPMFLVLLLVLLLPSRTEQLNSSGQGLLPVRGEMCMYSGCWFPVFQGVSLRG